MIYTYAFTSRKYAFFDDHFFFFLSRFLSFSLPLSHPRARGLAWSQHTRAHTHTHSLSPLFHACIRLACTYSINREPRYCTASPHLSALVTFTFARVSPHLRSSRNALRGGSHPSPRANSPIFFVVISINKEIPIQGRTLAYPMR